MKYKIGDKVRIKSLDWYNENKDEDGDILCKYTYFIIEMTKFCGKILTIKEIKEDETYLMEEDNCDYHWTDEMIECAVNDKREHFEKVSNAIKNYYKERPCRDCGSENGCDDCSYCEDGKRNWEMWIEVKKMITDYENMFNTSYEEDKKIFNKEPSPMFKIDDVVVTNDNLYGYVSEIKYDKDRKSFKYYVSFIVDGGYYYESQLKLRDNKEQMNETNNVCANAIAGNIIAEKDMLNIALSNGLILPKCDNKDLVKMDIGDVSDGYHTFNELYEYRLLYNASFFNELAKQNLYDVHKSKKHSDGEDCFGGGWFIVMAELPTGQVSNHYELKDWDLFQVPEKEKANKWDGHTPQDVAKRMRVFLNPKSKYPKTYEECLNILSFARPEFTIDVLNEHYERLISSFYKLLICRDAYWKIAGEEMGLGKPWEPIWDYCQDDKYILVNIRNSIDKDFRSLEKAILAFPTREMRDAFYDNFKDLIEQCKELL